MKKKKNNLKYVLNKYYTKCYGAFAYNEDFEQYTYGSEVGIEGYILKRYRNISVDSLDPINAGRYDTRLLYIFNNQLLKIDNRNKKYYFEFVMLLHKDVLKNIKIKNQYSNKKYSYIYISSIRDLGAELKSNFDENKGLTFTFECSKLSECIVNNKSNVFFAFENTGTFIIHRYSEFIGRNFFEYLICVKKKELFKYLYLLKKNLKKENTHAVVEIVKNTFDFFNRKCLYNMFKQDFNHFLLNFYSSKQSFKYFNYEKDLKDFYIIGDHLSCMTRVNVNDNLLETEIMGLIDFQDKKKYNIAKSKKFAKLGINSLGLFYNFFNYIYIP